MAELIKSKLNKNNFKHIINLSVERAKFQALDAHLKVPGTIVPGTFLTNKVGVIKQRIHKIFTSNMGGVRGVQKMKKFVAIFAIAFVFSAIAKVQVIPKAVEDMQLMKKAEILYKKNIKGAMLSKLLENETPENWFNLHPIDGVEGVGTEQVYLNNGMPESEDIIVAVIDSGVDVNHEDLQGKIWINKNEIPNNGIDDDNNGYIDDVFGWNFIGGAEGNATMVQTDEYENGLYLVKGLAAHQVGADTLEVTRELVRMKKLKETRTRAGQTLTAQEQEYLDTLDNEVRAEYTTAVANHAEFSLKLENFNRNEQIIRAAGYDYEEITLENLKEFAANQVVAVKAKLFLMESLEKRHSKARLTRIVDYFEGNMKYYFNENFNPRTIVGDNYDDQNERVYGNNDVIGPDSSHGTHVAGIIAAHRDNGIGMMGVATNVKIMAIRVVPNGDERDKDVANSIRYAVDNGAKVINMSFGKSYSPYKPVVNEAVKYAQDNGVLLVHAAGNSNQNNNTAANFPNRKNTDGEYTNWLEIGASAYLKGPNLPATFSNFGNESVDFFAPGVDIYSTTPDNKYDTYSGTSMASPTAAGVAALVLSYRPELTTTQLRELMINTSRSYPELQVYKPGTRTLIPFADLSIKGTVVDALEALQ
jgi:cell wall-associated protease